MNDRKIQIIACVLKMDSDAVLKRFEAILQEETSIGAVTSRPDFTDLIGVLTPSEAEEMKRIIDEEFEKPISGQ